MNLATIRFPDGAEIHLDEDGRWTGTHLLAVAEASATMSRLAMTTYRPDWPLNVATEIAAALGAEVVDSVAPQEDLPEDATP